MWEGLALFGRVEAFWLFPQKDTREKKAWFNLNKNMRYKKSKKNAGKYVAS